MSAAEIAPPAFALYAKPGCTPEDRLSAGASLNLYVPVQSAGAILFRRSLWLPIPAAARLAKSLDLGGSTLALRFAPADFAVETADRAWFSRASSEDNKTARLEFVWPAAVRRFHTPAGFDGIAMDLHRVDGQKVAEEASQKGKTGADLIPPWVGSPVEIRLASGVDARLKTRHRVGNARSRPRAAGGGSPVIAIDQGHAGGPIAHLIHSDVITVATIAGLPTSPRLKLFLQSPGEERLLWQGLVPGEQTAAVNLPAQALGTEWSAALEQIVKAFAEDEKKKAEAAAEAGAPLQTEPEDGLLRLDLESDAPCALTLQQASLALLARYALAPEPARLDFDGAQARSLAIALGPLPAGIPQGLTLHGRVDGDGAPAPQGGETPPRQGILLAADQALVLRHELAAAGRLAGLGLLWHPLSDELKGRVQLLADGGNGPGRPLLEQPFALPTPGPGWLALRWPSLDLQAQPLWLRLSLEAGAGLALAGNGPPPAGWLESFAATPSRPPLALAPACQWLDPADPALLAAGGLNFHLAGHPLAATRQGNQLTLTLPTPALTALGTAPLEATSAAPARLTLESAELFVGL